MFTATVYTRPGCMKCRVTTRKLRQLGVFVTEEQLDDHPDKIQLMHNEDRTALPLVEVVGPSGELFRWSDMSTADLDALAALMTDAA